MSQVHKQPPRRPGSGAGGVFGEEERWPWAARSAGRPRGLGTSRSSHGVAQADRLCGEEPRHAEPQDPQAPRAPDRPGGFRVVQSLDPGLVTPCAKLSEQCLRLCEIFRMCYTSICCKFFQGPCHLCHKLSSSKGEEPRRKFSEVLTCSSLGWNHSLPLLLPHSPNFL